MRQKNVLLIGSGNRARTNLLPALLTLKNKYKIVGIVSRSAKNISLGGRSHKVKTLTDLAKVDFGIIDIVVLSITLESVPGILKKLVQNDMSNITIFLDTPVIPLRSVFTLRLLKRFKHVFILEDYVATTRFDAVEKMIKRGTLGNLKKIYLFHSGFKYHAIAILKRLSGQKFVSSAYLTTVGSGVRELTLNFSGGLTSLVLEPRDYNVGRILIVGEKGLVSDYSLGGSSELTMQNPKNYNSLKIEALRKMFDLFPPKPRYGYCYQEAVYDNILTSVLGRFGAFYDIKLPFVSESLISLLIRFVVGI